MPGCGVVPRTARPCSRHSHQPRKSSSKPMTDFARPRVRMPRHGLALALLRVGIAWAFAAACVADAREYAPGSTPKAKYVAPLATWPATSYRAKDFTIVEWGGQFHLFYTRVQRHVPF